SREVMRDLALGPRQLCRILAAEDADVLAGIEVPVIAADQRLGEEDRVFDHSGDGKVVAVASPMLGEDGLVATRHAVAADVILLEMRGGDGEHVALPHSGGEPLPRVRRVVAGMGAAVEIDGSL